MSTAYPPKNVAEMDTDDLPKDETYVLVTFKNDIPDEQALRLWRITGPVMVRGQAGREMLVMCSQDPKTALLSTLNAFHAEGVTGAYYELHQIA